MYRKDKGSVSVLRLILEATAQRSEKSDCKCGAIKNADEFGIRVCDNRNEAHYWETYYSFAYGLPTTVFHVRGRRMSMSQDHIDKLFKEIDTTTNAERCYPIWRWILNIRIMFHRGLSEMS